MDAEYRKALSEMNYIINHLDEKLEKRIPENMKNFVKANRNRDYVPKFSNDEPFENQKLSEKTGSMLAMFYLLYWCDSKEEKEKLKKLLTLKSKKNKGEKNERN